MECLFPPNEARIGSGSSAAEIRSTDGGAKRTAVHVDISHPHPHRAYRRLLHQMLPNPLTHNLYAESLNVVVGITPSSVQYPQQRGIIGWP